MLIGDGNITRQIESLKIKPVIAVATTIQSCSAYKNEEVKSS